MFGVIRREEARLNDAIETELSLTAKSLSCLFSQHTAMVSSRWTSSEQVSRAHMSRVKLTEALR